MNATLTPLSAVLIVKNESAVIDRCLDSLYWVDEIVVLDTGSTDATLELCAKRGCRTYSLEKWEGFGKAKQEAVNLASHDWILSIDADEALGKWMDVEIKNLRLYGFDGCAWRLRRRSRYLGKVIRYCGWQNDAPLRIFNRKQGQFNANLVHEGIQTSQRINSCLTWLEHYSYPTREGHFAKMRFYGELSARQKKEAGKRSNPVEAVIQAALKFLKMYIFKLGFLDGRIGFQLCRNSAWGVWYKYHQLWKLGR